MAPKLLKHEYLLAPMIWSDFEQFRMSGSIIYWELFLSLTTCFKGTSSFHVFIHKPWRFCQPFNIFNEECHAYWSVCFECQRGIKCLLILHKTHIVGQILLAEIPTKTVYTFSKKVRFIFLMAHICHRSKRRASQRYVHFIIESAQYLYMDIHQMDGFFNWTMTYRFLQYEIL